MTMVLKRNFNNKLMIGIKSMSCENKETSHLGLPTLMPIQIKTT